MQKCEAFYFNKYFDFKKLVLDLLKLKIKITMESLNYTQLASVVLVLSVASLLLFIIIISLAISNTKRYKEIVDVDKRVDYFGEKAGYIAKIQKSDLNQLEKEIINNLAITKKNICDHVEARIKTMIPPKFEIGEKVSTADGIKGTITDIKQESGRFMYEITEHSYFGRPAKSYNRIEFVIMRG